MIVALTGMDDEAASDLAQELALLRASAGGKVLLVSPAQTAQACGLLDPRSSYDDVVIGAGSGTSALTLAAAGVIVVLIRPAELEARGHDTLLERIHRARAVNPHMQVLVSVAHAKQALSPHEVGCVLVFVAQISSARLADTLVLDDSGAYHTRHSEMELDAYKTTDSLCAPEVRHLYRQVFNAAAQY